MIHLRHVSAADLDLVCRHREEMFRESGSPETDLAAMAAPFRSWLATRLIDGRYFGFIAEWAAASFSPDCGQTGLRA
jgi:hypothetical protein